MKSWIIVLLIVALMPGWAQAETNEALFESTLSESSHQHDRHETHHRKFRLWPWGHHARWKHRHHHSYDHKRGEKKDNSNSGVNK